MVKAKVYKIGKHFVGEPKASDLNLIEEDLPSLKNGDFLVEAEYLSVDPYMRAYSVQLPLNSTMIGTQVAIIIESRNQNYRVGKRVIGNIGWRSHTVIENDTLESKIAEGNLYLLPDIGNLSPSLCLGVLGMPGNTAYFGLTEICKPQQGKTLVVSGAAGAVGSHVGQIAKNVYGLTVIGIAGSDEKCKWLTNELGFDFAINYKTQDIAATLRKAAPRGIDIYFDNVGGEISSTVIYQMNPFGCVSICGSISSYNTDTLTLPKCTLLQPALIFKQLYMEGFIVTRWQNRWMEGIQKNLKLIQEGKLIYRETITKGFENMFNAFLDMLHGKNVGKAIVEV